MLWNMSRKTSKHVKIQTLLWSLAISLHVAEQGHMEDYHYYTLCIGLITTRYGNIVHSIKHLSSTCVLCRAITKWLLRNRTATLKLPSACSILVDGPIIKLTASNDIHCNAHTKQTGALSSHGFTKLRWHIHRHTVDSSAHFAEVDRPSFSSYSLLRGLFCYKERNVVQLNVVMHNVKTTTVTVYAANVRCITYNDAVSFARMNGNFRRIAMAQTLTQACH